MILISTISYFCAMLFKVLLEVERDMFDDGSGQFWEHDCDSDVDPMRAAEGWFSACNSFDERSKASTFIVLLYFSFTSLSTVGLGDYVPKSNTERMVGAMTLLFGVMIFSLMMGNFIEIL